ncbi:Uncharacterised protein [Acinetobacter baumannii]|nr:Uncharacterised protein [Acinetobacter baumannii]
MFLVIQAAQYYIFMMRYFNKTKSIITSCAMSKLLVIWQMPTRVLQVRQA